jgi:hypothetical protein
VGEEEANALLPHRIGQAASSERRAAEEAERFTEREGKLANDLPRKSRIAAV